MRTLKTLIRMHDLRLQERRREYVEIETLVARLRSDLARLAEEIAGEQRVAGGSLEGGHGYGAYAQAALARRQRLEQSLQQAEACARQAADAVTEAFQEVKRYEVVLTRRKVEARQEADRLEQNGLDEISLEMFRRQKAG